MYRFIFNVLSILFSNKSVFRVFFFFIFLLWFVNSYLSTFATKSTYASTSGAIKVVLPAIQRLDKGADTQKPVDTCGPTYPLSLSY